MSEKVLTVKQVEGQEVAAEVIAQAVVDISEGIKKLRASRLTDEALVLLIQHAAPRKKNGRRYSLGTTYPARTIRDILAGLESLEATWVKKRKA